jgi:hypothetical protein
LHFIIYLYIIFIYIIYLVYILVFILTLSFSLFLYSFNCIAFIYFLLIPSNLIILFYFISMILLVEQTLPALNIFILLLRIIFVVSFFHCNLILSFMFSCFPIFALCLPQYLISFISSIFFFYIDHSIFIFSVLSLSLFYPYSINLLSFVSTILSYFSMFNINPFLIKNFSVFPLIFTHFYRAVLRIL